MSCHWHRRLIIALLFLHGNSVQAVDTSNVLIVDLYLNQQRMGETFVLQDLSGNYFVEEAVLTEWQISRPWPQPIRFRGTNYYSINQFVGASARLEQKVMTLHVDMPASLMPSRMVSMAGTDMDAATSGYGAYVDYEMNWFSHQASGQKTLYSLLRPVLFGAFGNITANTIYRDYSGGNVVGDEFSQSGLNILELTYSRDDPEKLRSLRIGDIFATGGAQGRALRLGGIQLATNFETQPMFITHPLPTFYGETAVPTALDVYVNGRLTRTENVQPGSYTLEDVPVVNGDGQLQVVARDALGRQQIFTQDFYTTTTLLKPGLHDYSINFGAIREEYGLENFRYGELAGSGTWRYGWRENLTIEGHGQFSGSVATLGSAIQYALATGGTVSTGLGFSSGDEGQGARWQIGFRKQAKLLNYNLDLSGSSREYESIGGIEGSPKLQFLASAGKNFFELGSFGASIVHQSFHTMPKRTIVSLNHAKSFNNFLSLSTFVSYADAGTSDFSFGLRVSMPFGEHHNAHGGFSSGPAGDRLEAEVNRSLPFGSGYGYRLGVGVLDDRYIDAGVAAQSEYGTYRLEVRDSEFNGSVWQASTSGSLAYLSGMTKMTRQVRDAFAVVNVGEFEGVRVYSENREIGRTNKNGQLFVPGLQPYLRNKLSIEIEDLPLNVRIGDIETAAAPYFRSGVVVNFNVQVSNNVLLRALQPDGEPVPEGAYATIDDAAKRYPIGRNGKLYLQGVDRSSRITVRWNNQACDLSLPFPDTTSVIAKLGDIACNPTNVQ